MKYMIVKHAGESTKNLYFEDDPQQGCHISYSAFYTSAGKANDISLIYDSKIAAEHDCKKLNAINPCGDYAVCPLLEDTKNG